MAFCSNCGHSLTGNEKFCAECGTATQGRTTNAAAAPIPAATTPPSPPPAPVTATPAASAPRPIPVAVPLPVPAQGTQQKKGTMGTVVVIVLLAGIGYYFYTRSHSPKPAAATPAPVVQAPPTTAAGSGGTNGAGSGVADPAALVNQQTFNAHWEDQSGMLVLTTATWANNSTTNIASATLQCRQYNSAGTDLSEFRVTLNGPTNAGASSTFSNISLGATASGMTKVDCSIIHVKP